MDRSRQPRCAVRRRKWTCPCFGQVGQPVGAGLTTSRAWSEQSDVGLVMAAPGSRSPAGQPQQRPALACGRGARQGMTLCAARVSRRTMLTTTICAQRLERSTRASRA